MVYARVELDDYTNRVLNVIKGKYGLKDKSEAINKMADMYGDELVEKEASDDYIRGMDKIYDEHIKKYGYRSMTLEELDKLCGL
jgi:hypothetical protein